MSVLVVKLGGHALDSLHANARVLCDLARDVGELRAAGTDVAIVHGGGPQIAALLDMVGVEGRFIDGLRVTDTVTMELVAMALALVNLRITAAFNKAGVMSVGLSGADGSLFHASSLGAPWDRAGGQVRVDTEIIEAIWSAKMTPVVSSIALDDGGDLLNCNADTAAGALAGALNAELVLLSDIDQLRADPDDAATALSSVTSAEIRHLLDVGAARDGMRPKVNAALDALAGGAQKILLANGTRPHALRNALEGHIPTTELVL